MNIQPFTHLELYSTYQ